MDIHSPTDYASNSVWMGIIASASASDRAPAQVTPSDKNRPSSGHCWEGVAISIGHKKLTTIRRKVTVMQDKSSDRYECRCFPTKHSWIDQAARLDDCLLLLWGRSPFPSVFTVQWHVLYTRPPSPSTLISAINQIIHLSFYLERSVFFSKDRACQARSLSWSSLWISHARLWYPTSLDTKLFVDPWLRLSRLASWLTALLAWGVRMLLALFVGFVFSVLKARHSDWSGF